eukprot:1762811-Ditylum_brightwellii.AAC.1
MPGDLPLAETRFPVHSTTPEETKQSGLFCDKQRLHEIHAQEFVNNNRGWIMFSWYKRGDIRNKSLTEQVAICGDDSKAESGDLSYHIAYLKLSNNTLLQTSSELGKSFVEKN